ncbi:MAG: 1-deoxy-D-xylulose-5-phosphate reductoisomerase [Acidobacteria bacterium]|nr:1-deoxy-D-xylulose-5-phosphate reductoisomerase [Acidobacteriota bacterium]
MRKLTVLGSTGSIGTSTLDVVRRHRDQYGIHALVAGTNVELLVAQIREFSPDAVVVAESQIQDRLAAALREAGVPMPELGNGARARVQAAIAPEVDFVMSAIVGVAGLEATYEAILHKKDVGLANKETLVAGGALVMEAVKTHGRSMIPVDSEHNGAHQCLRAGRREDVTKLILTASGGPFRRTPKAALENVTVAEALNHPTWKMGKRITIDSATLMNKGFEVIEACWLFDFHPRDVEVVVHPQSTVHALVEYHDGSVIAQICATDMRMPIQYALTYPAREDAPVPRLDWRSARVWEFEPPDFDKFPLLRLAYQAQETGGSATCTLNAADEIAVEAFLAQRLPFTGIAEVVSETLEAVPVRTPRCVQEILEIDQESRRAASRLVESRIAAAC